jgi:hypothetical protein
MIKSLPKILNLYVMDPCTVIWLGNRRRQSQNYDNFAKFSKSEVLHFLNLEQQRKTPKHDEASRPACYNDNQCNYLKYVRSIDSDGCGRPKNW